MKLNGTYEAQDFDLYINEGANWTFFKETLGLCIREGSPGKFLDVGSGLGFFVECCQRYGIPCEGLEGSEFAIQRAATRGVKLEYFDLTAQQKFPFSDNEFSVVLFSQVLEHLPSVSALHCLQEIHRCLVPGGIVIVLSPSAYNTKERLELDHINLQTPSQMKKLVEACGFRFVKYLTNWPRTILTRTRLEYFFWRQICRFVQPDWLSQGASLIAHKPSG